MMDVSMEVDKVKEEPDVNTVNQPAESAFFLMRPTPRKSPQDFLVSFSLSNVSI